MAGPRGRQSSRKGSQGPSRTEREEFIGSQFKKKPSKEESEKGLRLKIIPADSVHSRELHEKFPSMKKFFVNDLGEVFGVSSKEFKEGIMPPFAPETHISLSILDLKKNKFESILKAEAFIRDSEKFPKKMEVHFQSIALERELKEGFFTYDKPLNEFKGRHFFRAVLEEVISFARSKRISIISIQTSIPKLKEYYSNFGFEFEEHSNFGFLDLAQQNE